MKRERFFLVCTIALLVLNIGTLAFVFRQRKAAHERPGQDAAMYISTQLALDAVQQQKFEQLREEHQRKLRSLREEDRRLHDEFFSLMKAGPANTILVDSVISLIGGQRRLIERSLYDHLNALRGICRADQQARLNGLMDEIARRIMPGPPGGPPHQGPPPR